VAIWLTSTIAGLILLFSYRTSWGPSDSGAARAAGQNGVGIVSGPGSDPGTGSGSGSDAGTGSGSSGTGSGGEPTPTAAANGSAETVNGSVADTRWGPVQVQVVIASGRITDVRAIQFPNGNGRDDEINAYALPQLHDQVIAAQSANIDGVSGATVTSRGYIESLQAALDYAHFN
jgi:uncharacterized protein with FMN-binding domain